MKIADFKMPDKHPYAMLEGQGRAHTFEQEQLLTWVLVQCIEAGEFITVEIRNLQLKMDDLLEKVGDYHYQLTTKAKGLLYSVYGGDDEL